MNRKDEFKSSGSNNPATAHLEWKSEQSCFVFYDKEQGKNREIALPFKFLALKQLSTVKGFHEKSNSGIYSNEVMNMASEELKVKSFKGGDIAEGLWKDIKDKVDQAGGRFNKSIYAMTEKGKLINISLKGACVSKWFDFIDKNQQRLADEWVIVKSAAEEKKGRVDYTTPNFEFHTSVSVSDGLIADELYATIQKYITTGSVESEREIAAKQEAELINDDLGF